MTIADERKNIKINPRENILFLIVEKYLLLMHDKRNTGSHDQVIISHFNKESVVLKLGVVIGS